jgi:hypothetical protein
MLSQLLRDVYFAFSESPISRHRRSVSFAVDQSKGIRASIKMADFERAKGVMSSLSRGSVLLQLEKVADSDRENH